MLRAYRIADTALPDAQDERVEQLGTGDLLVLASANRRCYRARG
jgi:hypothetical protein